MDKPLNFALVIPLANEAKEFRQLSSAISTVLDVLDCGTVYLVVDRASKDNTRELCEQLSARDTRFITLFEPLNKHVVDAYLRGYREAYLRGHEFILEMDAGFSHDPSAIPKFLAAYQSGYECVFGSRFTDGGMTESGLKRKFLSLAGTWMTNLLLGSRLKDMTSGFQGFKREMVKQMLDYGLMSKAHFYQTEVRYLFRKKYYIEIPIHYKAPSPSVSQRALADSLKVLLYYFFKRITFTSPIIP